VHAALTTDIHARAVKLARGSALSFYDALVVAAAADAGCRVTCRTAGNSAA